MAIGPLKLTGPRTLNDDMAVLTNGIGQDLRDLVSWPQLLNAPDTILQLQLFERIFTARVHIDVDLPDAALSVTSHSGDMMTDLP